MAVVSIGDYPARVRDSVENFHGNILLFVGWDKHLMISSPMAFPLPPEMPFGALVQEVLPVAYSQHPEWDQVDWSKVEWLLDGVKIVPDMEADLATNGIGHKSLLRFETPELRGIGGSGS